MQFLKVLQSAKLEATILFGAVRRVHSNDAVFG